MSWRMWAALPPRCRNPIDDVDDEMEAVKIIEHHHVERRGGGALLLVPAYMNVAVIGAPVGETMDEPRIAVVGEDHRSIGGEQGIELDVRQSVRMLGVRLQAHQVHHVDDTDLQVGEEPRIIAVAARVSRVGMSPAQARTTSGSSSPSLLAHSKMPSPLVQCSIASSMLR